MLIGSVAQRAGIFVSTVYCIAVLGADRFELIVPLMPLAPLVAATALVGQEQSVLRRLLLDGAIRLTAGAMLRVGALVLGAGTLLSAVAGSGVALAFNVPFAAAFAAGMGGTALALAQATALSQVRAQRWSVAFAGTYIAFGAISFLSRATAASADLAEPWIWAIGDLSAGIAIAIIAVIAVRVWSHPRVDYDLRTGLRYGLPLFPHALAQQVLGNADRWILAGRVPATHLALYVTLYQIANGVNIVLGEFNKSRQHIYVGLEPIAARTAEAAERRRLLAIALALTAPAAAVGLLATQESAGLALPLAIALCLSFASLALYLPLANIMGLTLGNTTAMARASFSGAAVNVAINLALVVPLGVWGAVIANFAGFAAMFLALRVHLPHGYGQGDSAIPQQSAASRGRT